MTFLALVATRMPPFPTSVFKPDIADQPVAFQVLSSRERIRLLAVGKTWIGPLILHQIADRSSRSMSWPSWPTHALSSSAHVRCFFCFIAYRSSRTNFQPLRIITFICLALWNHVKSTLTKVCVCKNKSWFTILYGVLTGSSTRFPFL